MGWGFWVFVVEQCFPWFTYDYSFFDYGFELVGCMGMVNKWGDCDFAQLVTFGVVMTPTLCCEISFKYEKYTYWTIYELLHNVKG